MNRIKTATAPSNRLGNEPELERIAPEKTQTPASVGTIAKAYVGISTKSAGQTQKIARAASRNRGSASTEPTSATNGLAPSVKAANEGDALLTVRAAAAQPTASAADLIKACKASGASEKETAALMRFVAQNKVDLTGVVSAVANARGNGVEAGKAFAVLDDAIRNKLGAGHAQGLEAARNALRNGSVRIQRGATPGAYANYDRTTNTMTVDQAGVELSDPWSRTTLVHECEHVRQDADRDYQSRMTAEQEGHSVAADYYLHCIGAITETAQGPKLDQEAANRAMVDHVGETVDVNERTRMMQVLTYENARTGNAHLNGTFKDASAEELKEAINPDTFEEVYAAMQAGGYSAADIEAMKQLQQKDGL